MFQHNSIYNIIYKINGFFLFYGRYGRWVSQSIQCIKRYQLKDIDGHDIVIENQEHRTFPQFIIGGFIFGIGWAFTGACPGPLYALIGNGVWVVIVPLLMAIIGAFFYGILREKLPH